MRARTSSVAAPLHASPSLSVLRPGMKLFVHGPQIVAIDVGIELRGREVGVAEHLLHRPEIRPALEEMRRERVTQRVRRYPLGEPGAPRRLLDDPPGSHPRQ